MNLNTLVRHGVLGPDANREMVEYVATRLADPDEIGRSRQFPYQFLAAYLDASDEVPQKIKASLHKGRRGHALDTAASSREIADPSLGNPLSLETAIRGLCQLLAPRYPLSFAQP